MSKKGRHCKRWPPYKFRQMDVLCSDKTGTLTENRVKVIRHVDVEDKESDKVFLYSVLNSRYQTGLRSPLDEAVLKHEEINTDQYQKIDEIPFDFLRKRLSVVVKQNQENLIDYQGRSRRSCKIISHMNRWGINES